MGVNIVDVIYHTAKPFGPNSPHTHTQIMVVVDRQPDFVYDKEGQFLLAEDDGFVDALGVQPGSTGAFAGRKFDLSMKDGSVFHCHGQVWSCSHPRHKEMELIHVGVNTVDDLERCYVFCSSEVRKSKLDAWLADHTPSTDYYKYDSRHQAQRKEPR